MTSLRILMRSRSMISAATCPMKSKSSSPMLGWEPADRRLRLWWESKSRDVMRGFGVGGMVVEERGDLCFRQDVNDEKCDAKV